jgi:ABC-type uncharacterized transport system permease subunit
VPWLDVFALFDIDFFVATLRMAAPLIAVAVGGLICERSGIFQIGLEGIMLVGAFTAATLTALGVATEIAVLGAMMAGLLISAIQAFWIIGFRADMVVTGMAINLIALGGIPPANKMIFDVTSGTPSLAAEKLLSNHVPIYILVLALSVWLLTRFSFLGLYNDVAGRNSNLLESIGVPVQRVRFLSVTISGALAGLGGSLLSVWLSPGYTRGMTAGRGFIAIVAILAGRNHPLKTTAFCLFFASTEAMQVRIGALQGVPSVITHSPLVLALPYILTLFFLVMRHNKSMLKS